MALTAAQKQVQNCKQAALAVLRKIQAEYPEDEKVKNYIDGNADMNIYSAKSQVTFFANQAINEGNPTPEDFHKLCVQMIKGIYELADGSFTRTHKETEAQKDCDQKARDELANEIAKLSRPSVLTVMASMFSSTRVEPEAPVTPKQRALEFIIAADTIYDAEEEKAGAPRGDTEKGKLLLAARRQLNILRNKINPLRDVDIDELQVKFFKGECAAILADLDIGLNNKDRDMNTKMELQQRFEQKLQQAVDAKLPVKATPEPVKTTPQPKGSSRLERFRQWLISKDTRPKPMYHAIPKQDPGTFTLMINALRSLVTGRPSKREAMSIPSCGVPIAVNGQDGGWGTIQTEMPNKQPPFRLGFLATKRRGTSHCPKQPEAHTVGAPERLAL